MKRSKKTVMMSFSLILVIGIVGVVLYRSTRPPVLPLQAKNPETQTSESQLDYLTSAALPEEEKIKYVKAANPREFFKKTENLSDKEKEKLRKAVRPVFRAMRKKQVDEYMKIEDEAEKKAYIDEMIDERVERWKSYQSSSNSKKRPWRKPSMSRIKERIETSDPKERAALMGFRMDMHKRMKERNITPPWQKHSVTR